MARRIEIHEGSGNVYADLGLPDAEEAFLKSSLAMEIRQIVAAQKLTQAEVSVRTGLTQPKVWDVVNGRLKGYSVERLLTIINRLGRDVEVRISRRNVRQRPATVRVTAA